MSTWTSWQLRALMHNDLVSQLSQGFVADAEGVYTGNVAIHEGPVSLAGLDVNAVLAISNYQFSLGRKSSFGAQLACRACDAIMSPPEATIFLAAQNVVDVFVCFATRAGGVRRKVRSAVEKVRNDAVLFVGDVQARLCWQGRKQAGRGIRFL